MAVSLKKPSTVDLSKPDLPRELPSYTPIHLIDEEETIKSRPVPPPLTVIDTLEVKETYINFSKSDLEAKPVKLKNHERFTVAVGVVTLFAVVLSLVFLILAFIGSNNHIESSSEYLAVFDVFFSILSDTFRWILNSPLCLLIIGVSLFISFISMFNRIFR